MDKEERGELSASDTKTLFKTGTNTPDHLIIAHHITPHHINNRYQYIPYQHTLSITWLINTYPLNTLYQTLSKPAEISSVTLEPKIKSFLVRLEKQSRGAFSLPEFVEHFGADLQELADSSVSVAEAFAMLRMHLGEF